MGPLDNTEGSLSLKELLSDLLAPFEKLRRALDSSPQGLLVFEKSRVVFLNEAAEEYLNLQRQEIVGFPFDELHHGGPIARSVLESIRSCRTHQSPFLEDIYLGDRLIRIKASPAGDSLVLCTIERILRQPRSPAEGAAPYQDHPLQAATLMLAEAISMESTAKSKAANLSKQVMRLLSCELLRNEQPFSQKSDEGLCDFFHACRELLPLLRFTLPQTIKVDSTIPAGDSGSTLKGTELRSLLLQIVMDSVHEISQQGFLKLTARQAKDSVILELESRSATGSFAPVSEYSLEEARGLCNSLGGQLLCWTESNRRIRLINLPRAAKPSQRTPPPSNESCPKEGEGKTVLLVDDEAPIRQIGKNALQRFGYNVLLARDGLEGVQVFRKNQSKVDLVLLDLVMPRLGGSGCFERLKEIDPKVRVVLMSGFTRNHRVNDLMAKGCLFFLRKPFELTDLVKIVREAYLQPRY